MVVRASALLAGAPALHRARLGVLVAALALWESFAGELPSVGDGWEVALAATVLVPASFAVVWLLLPLREAPLLLPLTGVSAIVAILLGLVGADGLFNVAKLVTYALIGFCFLTLFEGLGGVVLVSAVVPWVDAFSVYRGPTKVVVEEQPDLFDRVAIAFTLPGGDASAGLGPPDVLFFGLFLAAARRFGLRAGWTWITMTALLSLTLVATYVFDLDGLPALPAVCLGFLAPNADLLVRRWREARVAPDGG